MPSVANVWADILSHQGDRDDWRVSARVFSQMTQRYGVHTVDLFASTTNAMCPRFNSKTHAPGSEAVDAFTVDWGGENNWINPPFSQASRVLNKIMHDMATAMVILPVSAAQKW